MPDTPLGITYPASSAHTRLWEHFEALALDVDALLTARTPLGGGAQLGSLVNLPSTATAMADLGVSVTLTAPTAGARWVAWWSGDFQLVTAGNWTGICQLAVDTVAQAPQAIWNPGNVTNTARGTVGQHATGTLATAGAHTWKLQAAVAASSSGSGRLNALHTNLSVLVLP